MQLPVSRTHSARRGIARLGILGGVATLGGLALLAGLFTCSSSEWAPSSYPLYGQHAYSGDEPGMIGVLVEGRTTDEGYVRVARVFPNMPAMEAGLMPGDLISEVDGQPVAGMPVPAVARAIRGDVETPVRVTVLRSTCPGSHLEFRLVRRHWGDLDQRVRTFRHPGWEQDHAYIMVRPEPYGLQIVTE